MLFDDEKDFLNVAIKAAKFSGEFTLDNLGKISKEDIGIKRAADFVTRVDKESESLIIKTIREKFPDHHILAEESAKEAQPEGYRWIIDPLDGTTNYIHQFPVFSVSIALEYKGEVILGVINDPFKKELFVAEKGKGAFLNGRPIHASAIRDMGYSLITTGFPFRKKEFIDSYLKAFRNIFVKASDLRRAGSAALDLAYVACGRCEGFFEIGLSAWDIAAGEILIKEAGGIITDFGGGRDFLSTGNVVAGNPFIHGSVLREIKEVFEGIINK
ncbi:MAG: inositol monophosphatase family protein [Nitrospirota bacterium]